MSAPGSDIYRDIRGSYLQTLPTSTISMATPRPHLPLEIINKILADPTLSPGYDSMVFTQDLHSARLE
ncbi:hypothetical protein LshimejAT787_1702060 [Lyophyllum shimeji]|uniref:Uncharacterized protein n=1 Tax=Lyophyllum shimeji TaxID=47721 RepID=A0A9P3PZX9_LYOSH|nr:hypothetical protein LshimejAT787_1702060 [Lyophyllum shimeji]